MTIMTYYLEQGYHVMISSLVYSLPLDLLNQFCTYLNPVL